MSEHEQRVRAAVGVEAIHPSAVLDHADLRALLADLDAARAMRDDSTRAAANLTTRVMELHEQRDNAMTEERDRLHKKLYGDGTYGYVYAHEKAVMAREALAAKLARAEGLLRQVRHHTPLPRGLEDAIDACLNEQWPRT